jgi:D-arabinose 1-dehydrogenase-like Zn-dependent alcohol dehydrogenase
MAERGRAAVLVADRKFEIREFPTPEVDPEGILVSVTGGGVCGSDLHIWRGEIKMHNFILGHELVGRVHSLGKNVSTDYLQKPLKEGDRVVFSYWTPCHRCYHCIRGQYTDCLYNFQGFKSIEDYPYCHGGFADYYYLQPGTFVFKVESDELSDEVLTSVNCAAGTVMEGIERSNIEGGDAIVFQGAGGLGMYGITYARERGAGVIIAIDGQQPRLDLALQCGADYTININEIPDPEDRVAKVKELVGGGRSGADTVVEVVGYPGVVPEGLEMLRPGGKYVEIGCIWPNAMATIDMEKVLHGIRHIVPVSFYRPQLIPAAIEMLERTKDKYPLTNLMSHTFSLEDINKAFELSEWSGTDRKTAVTRAIIKP